MIRAFHRWPGLLALALVTVLALSGGALSLFPAAERLSAPQAEPGLSVATLAARIRAVYPGVEQIRAGSGMFENLFMIYDSGSAALVIGYLGGGVISKARM